MRREYLLGLDAGGGSGRALLVATDGSALHLAARPWSHPAADGTGGLGASLDLDAVWSALAAATREALERAGAAPQDVVGAAATGMRFSLVVLDGEGRALLALPNRDGRAAAQSFELAARRGESLQARSGHWPTPVMALPRLLWLAAHDPERWARARAALALSDWIAFRLCGALATDPGQAAETLLGDLATGGWSADPEPGVPRALLPPVRAPGTRLGGLGSDAAEALGLRAGLPVAVGGGDTACGLFACGARSAGQAGAVTGTTAPVVRVLDRPRVEAHLWTGHHLRGGRWVLESNAGFLGEGLEWFGRLLFPEAAQPAARLLAEAAAGAPEAGAFFSTLGAEVMDARELHLPLGTLTLSHLGRASGDGARADLARAVVQGMACGVRANLERLGPLPEHLCLGGGLARSRLWTSLLADVLGRPVRTSATPEASALGAALCAAVGAGLHPDLDRAAALAGRSLEVAPDPERREAAEAQYREWQHLREARAASDAVARGLVLPRVLAAAQREARAAPAAGVRPCILATADLDASALAALRELGPVEHASFRERMRLLSGPALVEALAGVAVFVTEVDVVDAESLAKLPELRVIAACRGDAVNVDLEACTAYRVPVLHAPGRNADAVADLTLAFLLMLARQLPAAAAFLHEPGEAGDLGRMGRAFTALRGRELWGKTVGLVGFGSVGRAVARRLAGFGARLLVHDPFVAAEEVARAGGEPASLEELLAGSDFVSLHCGVSEATRGLLGAAELARMKRGAALVNTARAALVDEKALVEALRRGHLAGAALDVFPVEPPAPDHPLLRLPNVIATPHVGGNTVEVAAHQGALVAAGLGRLLRGERPRHVLNPAALDGFDWTRPRREPGPAELAALRGRLAPAVSDLQRGAPARSAPAPAPGPAAEDVPPALRDRLRRILERFVAGAVADPALRAAAEGREVTLHFVLSDVGLEFHLQLRGGRVEGALAAPQPAAEVQLRLRAEILDGMFTGRANPMQAAMEGKLSFTGDTAKAMTLQHLQRDLARLYRAAREAVGDPGDLASLPEPGRAAAAPAPSGDDVREEIVATVRELYAQELITATGGNVSARIPGRDELWITPSQLFKGDLRPEILVRIDLEGRPLDEGARAPSSERLMHCALYRRPEVRAVVHAHAPHATILANAGLPFVPISTEAAFFGEIPRVPFIMPGTAELAEAVAAAMGRGWAVLMRNHGLLVAARSLRRAADMVEIIDRSAQLILGCHAVGREPPTLPEDVVRQLRAMGDLVA
jgi:autoinducer 2 (AI-2) kinase